MRPDPVRLLRTSVFRLALGYAGGFVVVLAAVLAFAYWSTARSTDARTDAMLAAELEDLRAVHQRTGIEGLAAEIERRVKDYARDGIHYLLRAPDGRPLAGDLPEESVAGVPASGEATIVLEPPGADGAPAERPPVRVFGTEVGGGHTLYVGHALHVERAILTHALKVFSLTAGVAAALILAAGAVFGLRVVRRIDAVSRTAARIMAGDLSQRVPVDAGANEFSDLAQILNQMLDRIEALLARVREVSDNVAHDLRSPLTRLRSNLEITLLQPRDPDDYRRAIRQAIGETEDLLGTFNALLSIARAEAGPRDAELPPIDLRRLAAETVEIYEALASESGVTLELEGSEAPLMVRADHQLLAQALCNLIDNALKYTPRGGAVQVRVGSTPPLARVEVADSGPGIPAAQRARVLERFVRLDAARRLPGNGLGLSLVSAVAQYHRARLQLADNEPAGLRVILELAAVPAEPVAAGISQRRLKRGRRGFLPAGRAERSTARAR